MQFYAKFSNVLKHRTIMATPSSVRMMAQAGSQMRGCLSSVPARAQHTTAGPARNQHTAAQTTQTDNADFLNSKKAPFRNDFSREACDGRRAWVEHHTGVKLPSMGQWLDNQDTTTLRGNIEQPMGLIKVPVAPVGPLRINGEAAEGEFIAPFATTEGALTAAVQRGVNAINAGSGAITWTGQQHNTRGPCFVTQNPREALMLGNWTKKNKQRIQDEVVRNASSHAMLDDILTVYDMEAVHIVFQYTTGDACGQNVATVASWHAMAWIMENIKKELPDVDVKHAWVEANATMDKKPGALNILTGRGMATQAKCIIPEKVLNKYLNCTSEDYLTFAHFAKRMTLKNSAGGGWHINPGNTITAIFMAAGQDPACVSDSIAGSQFDISKHEGEEGGIEASLSFESLLVGSVGGGTALPTQQEGLAMMGCEGAGKARKLGEIVTAFSLALDLSTTSAITAGKFATGHDKLGRNRPEENKKSTSSA